MENSFNVKNIPQISKYQIVEELGRGGMGIVYKAFAPQMGIFLALKVISIAGEQEIQRFKREARAMAKMNHPNIIKIYNIGIENNVLYFTMPCIEGESLTVFLENTSLNIRLFSKLIVKVGKAVTYAHQQGIIHRDLKPGNIMLDKHHEPIVMDFGLAKVQTDESISAKGDILGTPQYMSPQQANGEKITQQTDVYALGAIFYEMLANKPLIEGESIYNILFDVVHKEPALLKQVNNKISKGLEAIVHKAIAKEMHKRYQSVAEFTEDIERFLHGEFIKAKTVGAWEKIWKKINKATVFTLIICLSLTTFSIWFFKNHHRAKVNLHLAKVKEYQQLLDKTGAIDKKLEIYLKISRLLDKVFVIFPDDFSCCNFLKSLHISRRYICI